MATKNDNHGLLTKMARLIRGQSSSPADAMLSEQGQESEFNRHALKERIERKRQDDIVRRREFNHLRKLRNTSPLLAGMAAARTSVFQNSTGFNPEERALTVKKIDEIEATMSKHWLERKPGQETQAPPSTMPPPLPTLSTVIKAENIPVLRGGMAPKPGATQSSVKPPKGDAKVTTPSPQLDLDLQDIEPGNEFDFTGAFLVPPEAAPVAPAAAALSAIEAFRNSRRGGLDAGVSVFSSSKMGAVELGGGAGSADLQEAAIRFAEGDDAGAEEVLLAALNAEGTEPDAAQAYCTALFDLYRGTGQQASFDVVAIDFAERFGKSAPEWFSTPELLARSGAHAASADQAVHPVLSRQIVWQCPANFDMAALKALRASLDSNNPQKHLNWGGLKSIEFDAAKELGELFARWCIQTVQLHFAGTDVLTTVLKSYTPSSDMRVDTLWWELRLNALRVLRLRDDFESVALDFCVVYELSPPCWEDALCDCVHELIVDEAQESVHDSLHPESAAMGLDGLDAPMLEFSGEILGDAATALEQLQGESINVDSVVISCSQLIRVDFTAAGNILNWAAQYQAKGGQIQFRDVPRLVASFFSVIGIDEHAAVVLRVR